MGQQLPYLPNGQSPFGTQMPGATTNSFGLPATAATLPASPASLPTVPGMASVPGAAASPIPGIDPRMMQQAQQSLANPNGGDINAINGPGSPGSLLPGPKELGEGALVGGATMLAFEGLDKINTFDTLAKGLDKIPGCKLLGSKLDPKITEAKPGSFWREFTMADAMLTPKDVAHLKDKPAEEIEAFFDRTAQKAVDNMETRQLTGVMEKFRNRFASDKKIGLKAAYQNMLDDMAKHGGPQTQMNFIDHQKPLPENLRISGSQQHKDALKAFNAKMEGILTEAKQKAKAEGKGKIAIAHNSDPYRTFYNFVHQKAENPTEEMKVLKLQALEEWQNTVGKTAHEAGALNELNRQFRYLDSKKHIGDGLSKEEKRLHRELYHIKERISGIDKLYTPLYRSQAKQTAQLSAEGVGPVGRTVRSFANYMQRIFRGDTMWLGKKSEEAGKGILNQINHHLGPFVMPLFMGATIFGFSFQSAKNAQPGEKKQAFFHNLLGSQIFNFIGWEFGRKLLNSCEFGTKVFRGFAAKTLPGFLKKIPLLGSATLGGFGTEIVAMLVFGGLFQKVGEKLSHMIFGKPSQASIDGKPAPAPGQPAPGQQAPAQNQYQNQSQNPNPALSGMFNPALMNQGMQQAGLPGGRPAYNPAQGMYQSATGGAPGAGLGGNPAMARAPQAPAAPQFSLSPAQISQSQVASDYNAFYSKLKADKSLDKGTGDILDRLNKP